MGPFGAGDSSHRKLSSADGIRSAARTVPREVTSGFREGGISSYVAPGSLKAQAMCIEMIGMNN